MKISGLLHKFLFPEFLADLGIQMQLFTNYNFENPYNFQYNQITVSCWRFIKIQFSLRHENIKNTEHDNENILYDFHGYFDGLGFRDLQKLKLSIDVENIFKQYFLIILEQIFPLTNMNSLEFITKSVTVNSCEGEILM